MYVGRAGRNEETLIPVVSAGISIQTMYDNNQKETDACWHGWMFV